MAHDPASTQLCSVMTGHSTVLYGHITKACLACLHAGFVTYFNSTAGNASNFQMTLSPDSLHLVSGSGYNGVNGTLSFNQNARMVRALLGG